MNEVNRAAFLKMITVSELGDAIIAKSDEGFNVIVGSTAERVHLFNDYSRHPGVMVWNQRLKQNSSAAGAFQIMEFNWNVYKKQLNLPDFGKDSQRKIAMQLIKECKALEAIDAGRIDEAVSLCRSRWASFPGAGYRGQHENTIEHLRAAYVAAGGSFS
jgi:muramidase (phage lysozyme)